MHNAGACTIVQRSIGIKMQLIKVAIQVTEALPVDGDRMTALRTPTMKESQLLRKKTTSSVFVSTCSNPVHAQFH